MKNKSYSKVFLAAAKLIDSGREEFSCLAVKKSDDLSRGKALRLYETTFDISEKNTFAGQLMNMDYPYPSDEEIKQLRVFALCLMAAMSR